MTLAPGEFIRRFLMHVLPKGFHRIRHYGLFASGNRADNIARLSALRRPDDHHRNIHRRRSADLMACARRDQDRNLMISLATPSRNAIPLHPADPQATTPHARSPVSTATAAAVSPFLTEPPPIGAPSPLPSHDLHTLPSPLSATVGAPNSP
jgi:Putative transposase